MANNQPRIVKVFLSCGHSYETQVWEDEQPYDGPVLSNFVLCEECQRRDNFMRRINKLEDVTDQPRPEPEPLEEWVPRLPAPIEVRIIPTPPRKPSRVQQLLDRLKSNDNRSIGLG